MVLTLRHEEVPASQISISGQLANGTPHAAAPAKSRSPVVLMPETRRFDRNASIILVGMRGAGKRSLGFIAATQLGRRFVTQSGHFQKVTGLSKAAYLEQNGKPSFYRRSNESFRQMLAENPLDCVIECGIDSLARESRNLLQQYSQKHPVIHIVRDHAEIRALLRLEEKDAQQLKVADMIHRSCSNFEFFNLYDPSCDGDDHATEDGSCSSSLSVLRDAKIDFSNFVNFIIGRADGRLRPQGEFSLSATPLELRSYTYAVTWRLSDSLKGYFSPTDTDLGGDAVEFVVDARTPDLFNDISKEVASIRRLTGMPIVYTVDRDSATLWDHRPKQEELYLSLLDHGIRLGVDYVSVNLEVQKSQLLRLVSAKAYTKVIGHLFEANAECHGWLAPSRTTIYKHAIDLGVDMVRLVQKAYHRQDNEDVRIFRRQAPTGVGAVPLIAYNVGELGKASLISNKVLTPVNIPGLRHSGEVHAHSDTMITAREATQALSCAFELDALQFFVMGAHVSNSLLPQLHNAAYKTCGFSHVYSRHEPKSVEEMRPFLEDRHFGGASIASPYKVEISSRVTSKSPDASAIGAVTTLLPIRQRENESLPQWVDQVQQQNRAGVVLDFYGENADWSSILTCLRRRLSPRNAINPSRSSGLVLGAGGVARAAVYAMLKLGCQNIFICNRTTANAVKVANHFNSWASNTPGARATPVRVLERGESTWPSDIDPPTMIVGGTPVATLDNMTQASSYYPEEWFRSPSGGVVLEVAYSFVKSPLLKQARRARLDGKRPWVIADSSEYLLEIALAHFELMTGRKAPRHVMQKIIKEYNSKIASEGTASA